MTDLMHHVALEVKLHYDSIRKG